MKKNSLKTLVIGLPVASALFLSGCVTQPPSLYYWGEYQPQVYGHFTKNSGTEAQILALEAGLEKARAEGKTVPPGYNAHLGILYAQNQHADQMLKYFNAEKAMYPESEKYMDFLMRKFQK